MNVRERVIRTAAPAALLSVLSVVGVSAGAAHGSGQASRAPKEAVTAVSPARTSYFVGKAAVESDERRRHFAKGVEEARAVLARNPNDPEGLLWLAANLGAEAAERSKFAALRALSEMERLLLRLEEVAPLHDGAAAARILGRIYHKAPPLISVGSNKRAREFFERALKRAGSEPANQILAADFFADEGEDERARSLARAYLQAPIMVDHIPERKEASEIVRRILGQQAISTK